MTTVEWKSFSVRLDKPRKEELDNLVGDYINDSDLNKADAVYRLIKLGLDKVPPEGLELDAEDGITIAMVLNQIQCSYLTHDNDGFSCLEKLHSKKKADPLGLRPSRVLTMCRACANKKMEIAVQKQNDMLNKAGAKQLKEFIKRMIQLKDQDFSVDVFLCMGETTDMKLQASADGQSFRCPLLPEDENQTVYIDTFCKQRINSDGSTGCDSLYSYTTVANLDESFFNQFEVKHPELENVTEVTIQPNMPKSVEADFEVIEESEEVKP